MRSKARIAQLTKQEKKILRLACEQHQDDEIAAQLKISLNTVASHWRSIRLKMNCDSKFQVISQAFQNGIKKSKSGSSAFIGHLNLPVIEFTGPLAEIVAEAAGLPGEQAGQEPVHLLVRCQVCADSDCDKAEDGAEAAELRAGYNM